MTKRRSEYDILDDFKQKDQKEETQDNNKEEQISERK